MQPVAAVIHVQPFEFEAARVAADLSALFKHCGLRHTLPAQMKGGAQACRTGAQDCDTCCAFCRLLRHF